jgi:ubiquinone/menaquinone biosynthesis C-methylase UbiE
MKSVRYIQTLGSFRHYYRSINEILVNAFGKIHMLHYPFYMKEMETLEERQHNLIEHCLSYIGDLKGMNLLEVGCGNGLNCHYIDLRYEPSTIVGIDLNKANLKLARAQHEHSSVSFLHDDAQELETIPDHSIDVMICIESAFHYPDKSAFFKQIHRVLRPNGIFLIVDIIRSPSDNGTSLWFWKKSKLFFHANEEEYHQFSSSNNLIFKQVENITDRIIQGYEGHLSWIKRENMNLMDYLLMKLFSRLQVRLNVAELRSSKQYMLFYGERAPDSLKQIY